MRVRARPRRKSVGHSYLETRGHETGNEINIFIYYLLCLNNTMRRLARTSRKPVDPLITSAAGKVSLDSASSVKPATRTRLRLRSLERTAAIVYKCRWLFQGPKQQHSSTREQPKTTIRKNVRKMYV